MIWIENGAIAADGNPEEICAGLIEKSNSKYLDFDIEKMIQN